MLDWDDLRHFLLIARHHTLSAAARALGVEQSTMGRRLAIIERHAGAKLLQKTPSGFVLTATGEAILDNVERIEAEALAVEHAILGKDERLAGTVRITAVDDLTSEIVIPILARFRDDYPQITFEFLTDARFLSLPQREADVALRYAQFSQADLAVRKVAEIGYGIYASRSYLDRHGLPDFTQGAPGHRAILAPENFMAIADMVWFTELTSQSEVALRGNTRYVQVAAAHAGMGLASLPRYLGDPSGLVQLETPAPAPARALWMGVHKDIRHTPRIRAVTECLVAGFKQRANLLNPRNRPGEILPLHQ